MDYISLKKVTQLSKRRNGITPCDSMQRQVRKNFGEGEIRVTRANVKKFVNSPGGKSGTAWIITECLTKAQLRKVANYVDPDHKRSFHNLRSYWWSIQLTRHVRPYAFADHIRRWDRERLSEALYQIIKSL